MCVNVFAKDAIILKFALPELIFVSVRMPALLKLLTASVSSVSASSAPVTTRQQPASQLAVGVYCSLIHV